MWETSVLKAPKALWNVLLKAPGEYNKISKESLSEIEEKAGLWK